jgi:ribosomal protein L3
MKIIVRTSATFFVVTQSHKMKVPALSTGRGFRGEVKKHCLKNRI